MPNGSIRIALAYVADRQRRALDALNTINVIAPYRHHGTWVFDDPRMGLVQEPCIRGADNLIDRTVANTPGCDRGLFLIFSDRVFPGYTIRLIWSYSDMDGHWYCSNGFEQEAWRCPGLLQYFKDVPKALYVQCKAKPSNPKHSRKRTAEKRQRIADCEADCHQLALPLGLSGASHENGQRIPDQVMPDSYVPHSHRAEAHALLRVSAVIVLFLVVIGSLTVATMGLLSRSRPNRYVVLFLVWIMGITGFVMIARLWRAIVISKGAKAARLNDET